MILKAGHTMGNNMDSFTLTLEDDGFCEPKRIEFTAPDPGEAFLILEREGSGRTAILWQGRKRLGTLQRTETGVWQLAG